MPDQPPASGSLELTASLLPDSLAPGAMPANLGAIQPTLSWGPTCAAGGPHNDYASWRASGQYVNASGMGPAACQLGPSMDAKVGDTLEFDLALEGTVWTETITDDRSTHAVTFTIDLGGQPEVFPTFAIDANGQSPDADVIFGPTTFTLAEPEPTACQPSVRGPTDSFSTPAASASGTRCCLSYIVLRAQGVPATTTL